MGTDFASCAAAAMMHVYTAFAETVTYSRGGDSVSLSAIRGGGPVEMQDASGVFVRVHRTEFALKAADLVLDGSAAVPQRGDSIVDSEGDAWDVPGPAEYLPDTGEWLVPVQEVG